MDMAFQVMKSMFGSSHVNMQKPQRPQAQYAAGTAMSNPASSAFTPLSGAMNAQLAFQGLPQGGQQGGYPEISLASQLGLFFPPQNLGQQQQGQEARAVPQPAPSPKSVPVEPKGGGSAYASRHQAAEQRRRTRINERLDKLRTLVPHAERANTASFLEEVIHYVEELQAILGLAPQQRPPTVVTPMKQPQAMEFNQLYGSAAGSGDFVAATAAGGGVTSAAYAAIAQQQQAQQQQAQQQQHAQQGNGGMPSRLRELSNLTAEQASVLALQGGLGDYSGAEINEMIANVRREGVTGPSHNSEGGEDEIPAGLGVGGNVGQIGRSKRGIPGTAVATGPAAGSQATDSDGSDGRPLKKRVNR